MNTCETCRFWGDEESFSEVPVVGLRKCDRIPHGQNATEWDTDRNNVLMPEHVGVRAFVLDGSGYRAELVTLSDFGCIEHQPKEPKDANIT